MSNKSEEPEGSINYTIVMCNFEMGDTLSESVESIYAQVTAEFEILVVDGGSSDKSIAVLDDLENEYNRVRSIRLDQKPQRRLGEERNIGVREAHGNYILLQMDTDDRYSKGIIDFVEVYHQLEDCLEKEFYLKGNSINMAPRDFLLTYGPYRNIHAGEDKDLWRRLFADDVLIWLEHDPFWEEIKNYKNTFLRRLRRAIDKRAGDLQSGVSFISCLRWANKRADDPVEEIFLYSFAYMIYFFRDSYSLPYPYDRKGALREEIDRKSGTLLDIESSLDQSLNHDSLSSKGKEIFLNCRE